MREKCYSGSLSRYDMSYFTFRQLQRDHINFEEKYADRFSNSFICQILLNYMCYAQNNFCDEFEKSVTNILKIKSDKKRFKDDRITFTIELTKKFIEFDFAVHSDFKKRPVITYILESFALQPLSEREKIYNYQHFKTIEYAINNHELLLVRASSGKEYEIKPYSIDIDDNSGSYYLIGYSRPKASDKEYECHSFKLSRIRHCISKHRQFSFSGKEISSAKEICEKFGCAYMVSNLTKMDIEKTVVRLTAHGYEVLFLKIISHQRPIPVSEPKPIQIDGKVFFDLEFDCSYYQIRNYFFSFGSDAEIISPVWLREKVNKEYCKAIKNYQPSCDE